MASGKFNMVATMQSSDPTDALTRLRNKVALDPGDLDASLRLGSMLYQACRYDDSASVFQSLLYHHPDNSQALLLLARSLARASRQADALRILARAQWVNPQDIRVWQVASALAAELRDWPELLRIGHEWTRIHPGSVSAWQALSRAHFEESRFNDAISAHARVLELTPEDPLCLIAAARLAIAAQNYEQARRYLDIAQRISSEIPELLYTMGRLYHLTGELERSEHYCRRAIAARPGFATAYVELGTLCQGRLDDAEIEAVRQLFDEETVHPEYRVMLGFTLGEALDRRQDYDQAFSAWNLANEINRGISLRENRLYQPALIESDLELVFAIFNDLAVDTGGSVSAHAQPVFVLGMPRSGTTLIESILASHSDVHGAGELPTLYDIHESLMVMARCQGVAAARDMVRSNARNWRDRYLAALPCVPGKTRIVDKQPLNFRTIGLIRLLFPGSPIIYAQRDAMDVCFSIYRHKFSKDWPCAHRLADIGHYYGVHERIMTHWQARHAESIHVIDHGLLVRDKETHIRELLAFTGLDFEPACLSPHTTRRAIATFSAVQVRQPVSASFGGRSAPYHKHLEPLRRSLRHTTEPATLYKGQP